MPVAQEVTHLLGWCMTGHHEDAEAGPCPGIVIHSTGQEVLCSCSCHA